jgi:hypothetical protein
MLKVLCCLFVLFSFNASFGQATYEVLITEIFADPTPSHGLPDKEFIELYNNSVKPIDLSGYTLFYNTTDVDFPSHLLEPEAYVIVCRENNSIFFESYGAVLGLSKFSLLNGGTNLRLLDSQGNLSHEVNYSSSWYAAGRDQGYSLEMIDMNYPCNDFGNWTSSASEIGGTPGEKNASAASNPDLIPPAFIAYEELSTTKFAFVFSENLNQNEATLQIESELLTISKKELDNLSLNTIIIEFDVEPGKDQLYDILFNAISDCSGNMADPINVSVGNIPSPTIGEVLLSEVLFNPKANGVDFVELYNSSSKQINLRGFSLSKLDNLGEMEVPKVLFTRNRILEPKSFLVVTEDKWIQSEIYPNAISENMAEVTDIPSYNNDAGSVILLNSNEDIMDQFNYNEDIHHASIDDVDGISLERIDFEIENKSFNWQSSSSSENFATPGYKIWNIPLSEAFTVTVNPAIITPDNDGIDEEALIEYSVPVSGNITSKIFDINGKQVVVLANNLYLSNQLKLNWNGLDAQNQSITMGYYILYSEYRLATGIYQNKQKILVGRR